MPRVARIYTAEGIFHILTRGNNKQWIFQDVKDFNVYKEIVIGLKQEHSFKLYHWCLMNNHIHMIIETNEDTNLSKMMKRLNLIYYNHYKKKHSYAGHFWQDRFKSLLIGSNEYLFACGRYIERNPVRAKIIKSPKDYLHSSYNYYAYGKEDNLTEMDPFYKSLGRSDEERQEAYRKKVFDIEKEITGSIFNQLFLGTKEFIRQMENRFKVKNVRLKKGRPRKKK